MTKTTTSEQSTIEVLHRDDLPLGGFAGLREHRLVMDFKAWRNQANPSAWQGLGNFVYLADARFIPKGETGMHPHREVDVISVMVEGRIAHGGTLEHGQELEPFDVQVQRAGGGDFYSMPWRQVVLSTSVSQMNHDQLHVLDSWLTRCSGRAQSWIIRFSES